jgi:hypothetical protein
VGTALTPLAKLPFLAFRFGEAEETGEIHLRSGDGAIRTP